jgi:hypothetical protein
MGNIYLSNRWRIETFAVFFSRNCFTSGDPTEVGDTSSPCQLQHSSLTAMIRMHLHRESFYHPSPALILANSSFLNSDVNLPLFRILRTILLPEKFLRFYYTFKLPFRA